MIGSFHPVKYKSSTELAASHAVASPKALSIVLPLREPSIKLVGPRQWTRAVHRPHVFRGQTRPRRRSQQRIPAPRNIEPMHVVSTLPLVTYPTSIGAQLRLQCMSKTIISTVSCGANWHSLFFAILAANRTPSMHVRPTASGVPML